MKGDGEFLFPIGGGRRVKPDETAPDEELLRRLDEFDAVRNRGAVEARSFYLRPRVASVFPPETP